MDPLRIETSWRFQSLGGGHRLAGNAREELLTAWRLLLSPPRSSKVCCISIISCRASKTIEPIFIAWLLVAGVIRGVVLSGGSGDSPDALDNYC